MLITGHRRDFYTVTSRKVEPFFTPHVTEMQKAGALLPAFFIWISLMGKKESLKAGQGNEAHVPINISRAGHQQIDKSA